MRRNLAVHVIQPQSRRKKWLARRFVIAIGQRGASARVVLSEPQARWLHQELGKALRRRGNE